MIFRHVIVALNTSGHPPSGSLIHGSASEYVFAPLSHDDAICTIDMDLWRLNASEDVASSSYDFCPDAAGCERLFLDSEKRGLSFLLALTKNKDFQPLGWPKCRRLLDVTLTELNFFSKLIDVGFDVIDCAGLSSLVNVGYSLKDVSALIELNSKMNSYGLIADQESAERFAVCAARLVPEHAPFIPVKVLVSKTTMDQIAIKGAAN